MFHVHILKDLIWVDNIMDGGVFIDIGHGVSDCIGDVLLHWFLWVFGVLINKYMTLFMVCL